MMTSHENKEYLLLAGWSVRLVKNCHRSLENTALNQRPRVVFSGLGSQFFTIQTDHELFHPIPRFSNILPEGR